jgi:hypothetical protein
MSQELLSVLRRRWISSLQLGRGRSFSISKETDVIIIGAGYIKSKRNNEIQKGPVGTSMSLFLAKNGIKSTILEKESSSTAHPQAHFIHSRTMELFRTIYLKSKDNPTVDT